MTIKDAPRIICFGDSLTVGYQSGIFGGQPLDDAPYGRFLQQWMGSKGCVVVSGMCGELATEMTDRFQRDVLDQQPLLTIILGGTNDLGYGLEPAAIVNSLCTMYSRAQMAGIHVVGVTVPSIRIETAQSSFSDDESCETTPAWLKKLVDQRKVLNHEIQRSCASLHIPCVDLFAETVEGPDQLLAEKFSSDGLHLNTQGYEHFARLVWNQVLAFQFT